MNVHRLRTLLLAGALAIAVIAGASLTGTLEALEHDSVDMRFGLREDKPPKDIVVVAVDDVTFSDLEKQWPFPRSYFADVTDVLHDGGAREIVFDVQFTEETTPGEDWALYDAVDRAGGAVFATSETDGKGDHRILGGEKNLRAIGATGAASNLPDEDSGVIRRFSNRADDLPTIAAAVARREGRPVDAGVFEKDGTAWIDFRGGPGTVRTYSFSDVYNKRVSPQNFEDKIVVIGASAPTLQDVHPTSTARSQLMSGPEIQANAIWTAVHGMPLRPAPAWLGLLAIVMLSIVVPLAGLRMNPIAAVLTGALAGAVYLTIAWVAFTEGVIVDVVAPLLGLAVATVTGAVAGHLVERRARRRIAEYSHELEQAVRERTADLDALQVEIIERLGQAVDSRDNDTGEHIRGIGALSYRLARAIGLDEDRAEMLRRASAMHDVGKIAIPDAILQHPGPLNAEQWAKMKTHTTEGAKILAGSRSPLVRMAEVVALTHHEKWTGEGYPNGLAGEDIPLEGRIVALCDVYDALVSERPYKKPWTHDAALDEIERSAGTHFDPDLAKTFIALMRDDQALRAASPALEPEPVPAA